MNRIMSKRFDHFLQNLIVNVYGADITFCPMESVKVFFNSHTATAGLLLAFSWFLQFKELELFWGAVFF